MSCSLCEADILTYIHVNPSLVDLVTNINLRLCDFHKLYHKLRSIFNSEITGRVPMVLGNSLFNLDFQEARHTIKLDITKVVSAYSTVFMGMSLLEYFQEIQ